MVGAFALRGFSKKMGSRGDRDGSKAVTARSWLIAYNWQC